MSENGYSTLEIRVRAVDAVLRGQAKGEVANAFSVNRGTLYRWVNRYQQDGDHGLRRKIGSGRPRKLEELKEHELCEIILQPASAFDYETDLWTVGRLHCVITECYQIDVSKDTIWRRLREAGLTYQKPERAYYEADEQARQKWRRYEVPKIRRAVKEIQGYSVLSGRGEHFVDRAAGEDVGSPWPNSHGPGHRKARRSGSHVCPQAPWSSRVSLASKTNCFARSD